MPAVVFAAVFALHFAWLGVFSERGAAQARWETVAEDDSSWISRYVARQGYWQGYAYAVSLGFAAVAVRRFRERRLFGAGKAAVGGATLSGALAVAGRFLAGCCGSPMLGVYLSLFGASFLPWTKPLVAGLTTAMIAGSYWWMRRKEGTCCGPGGVGESVSEGACGCSTGCGTGPGKEVKGV